MNGKLMPIFKDEVITRFIHCAVSVVVMSASPTSYHTSADIYRGWAKSDAFLLRQYNVMSTAKHQICILFEQF